MKIFTKKFQKCSGQGKPHRIIKWNVPTRNHHDHRNLVHTQDAQLNGERQDFDYARALRKQLLFPPMWSALRIKRQKLAQQLQRSQLHLLVQLNVSKRNHNKRVKHRFLEQCNIYSAVIVSSPYSVFWHIGFPERVVPHCFIWRDYQVNPPGRTWLSDCVIMLLALYHSLCDHNLLSITHMDRSSRLIHCWYSHRIMGREWKGLADAEKQKYVDESNSLRSKKNVYMCAMSKPWRKISYRKCTCAAPVSPHNLFDILQIPFPRMYSQSRYYKT